MPHEFHLPDIGEGLTEATIVRWWVEVGEPIAMDAPLVEVETDKAIVDLPSPFAGTLLHRGAAEGETVPVESLLAVIGEPGESWAPEPASLPSPSVAAAPIVGRLEEAPELMASGAGSAQALPLVRKLAADLGVDLSTVAGTGIAGRITEDDVRVAATEASGPERLVKMSPVRRAVAENLARSWREIPHVTTYGEADAAFLLDRRRELGKPPLEALLIERIIPLLERFPDFNAQVRGDHIVHKLHYDIGLAVDTPDGLMVAVVKDAAGRDLPELAEEIRRLAAAARDRTARPDELRGQTFTISNIGAVGGRYGTPIVPYGTTAILSIGRADAAPVVRSGEIVVGWQFPLSLSYDHRAIDGSTGRAFMGALIEALEA